MEWPLRVLPFQRDIARLLVDLKAFVPPPITKPYRQIERVAQYLESLGCGSIALETEYIDRDFMEDYSVFYSRNLKAYPNYCVRLHFFRGDAATVERKFLEFGAASYASRRDYVRACRTLSDDQYLGFCVVKPLGGTPIGRTVLRTIESRDANTGLRREFASCRLYHAHYAGVDLTVTGLAFQQQDVGVSACATTALWSSLNKARELEDTGATTPAQITSMAAQFALPFGRSMPSEGLSLDQMCQAIRAIGLAPHLLKCPSYQGSLLYLYTALRSGFAPVLVLRNADDGGYHAVTGVGMDTRDPNPPIESVPGAWFKSLALRQIFVNDDRIGPIVEASFHQSGSELQITPAGTNERWALTHIVLPLHNKIRVSLADLHAVATELLRALYQAGHIASANAVVAVDGWIEKGVDYFNRLRFADEIPVAPAFIQQYCSSRTYSRYVAVIRIVLGANAIDVLIDTTSTFRNIQFLAVSSFSSSDTRVQAIATFLAGVCKCALLHDLGS